MQNKLHRKQKMRRRLQNTEREKTVRVEETFAQLWQGISPKTDRNN